MDKSKLAETIRAAQRGDDEAFERLYLEYAKRVYYLALKITKNREDAEDITQDVFISVVQKIGDLKEPEAFGAWLNRITVNKCTSTFKNKLNVADADVSDFDETLFMEESDPLLIPEKSLDNAETARMIVEIIDALPDPQRLCVYYYYYEQMTIAQIAEILETNENTVKKRLYLARDKIRRELERLNDEEGTRLYSFVPLMLTPILKISLREFEMPAAQEMWTSITAATGNAVAATGTTAPAGTAATVGAPSSTGATFATKTTAATTGTTAPTATVTTTATATTPTATVATTATIATTATATGLGAKIAIIATGLVLVGAAAATLVFWRAGSENTDNNSGNVNNGIYSESNNDNISNPESQGQTQTGEDPKNDSISMTVEVGELIQFGDYDWRVLAVQDGKALIITDEIIESLPYHSDENLRAYEDTLPWADSDLRAYLNTEFYNRFNDDEKARIAEMTLKNSDNYAAQTADNDDTRDRIFLPDISEAVLYFGDSGFLASIRINEDVHISDEYNSKRVAINSETGDPDYWWLRSCYVLRVTPEGEIIQDYNASWYLSEGVRPAMWVTVD